MVQNIRANGKLIFTGHVFPFYFFYKKSGCAVAYDTDPSRSLLLVFVNYSTRFRMRKQRLGKLAINIRRYLRLLFYLGKPFTSTGRQTSVRGHKHCLTWIQSFRYTGLNQARILRKRRVFFSNWKRTTKDIQHSIWKPKRAYTQYCQHVEGFWSFNSV